MEDSANTILVVGKRDPRVYVACIVLASTRLDVNGTVRKRIGIRRTSFASAAETMAVTGMTIGGVTPFGLPEDLPIWIDQRVTGRSRIILGGGSRDRKVLAAPSILEALPNAVLSARQLKQLDAKQTSLLETVSRVVNSQQAIAEAIAEPTRPQPEAVEFAISWQRGETTDASGLPDS